MDVKKILDSDPKLKKEAIKRLVSSGSTKSLEALILLSLDKDPSIRYYARKGLSLVRHDLWKQGRDVDSTIKELFVSKNIDILKSGSPSEQIDAAKRLGRSDAGSFAKALVEVLKASVDPRLTATLLKTIALSCGSRSLSLIKSYLKSGDHRVRANAVEAISTLEIAERFDLILPFLDDPNPRVASNSAVTLWGFSKVKVLGRLRSMLESKDPSVSKSAVWSLKTIGTVETRHLLSRMNEEHPAYDFAQEAMDKIDNALEASLTDGVITKERLLEAVSGPEVPTEEEVVASQVSLLESEDPKARLEALKQLSQFRRRDMVPRLISILETDTDRYVIATVVKLLGLTAGSEAIPAIRGFLGHEDARIRANCVEGLSTVDDDKVIPLVAPLLLDGDSRVKANAAFVIYRRFPDKTLEILQEMLCSGDTWKALSAAYALGRLGDHSCEEILLANLEIVPDGARQKVREIVEEIKNRRQHSSKVIADELSTTETLPHSTAEEAMADFFSEDSQKRLKSLKSLCLLGDPEHAAQLIKAYPAETNILVRAETIRTAARILGPDGVRFASSGLEDKGHSVRVAAAEALAAIGTDDALAALSRLLDETDGTLLGIGVMGLIKCDDRDKRDMARSKVSELAESESPLDRDRAIKTLNEVEEPWAATILRKLSKDMDISIAGAAKAVLEKARDRAARKARDEAEKVSNDISALDSRFVTENREYLIDLQVELLGSPDLDLKNMAQKNLNTLLSKETLDHFKHILMSQQNKFLKATLIKTVGMLKNSKTVDVLEPFLKDFDPRVRANTVEALTGFDDPVIFDMVSPLLYDSDDRVKTNAYRLLVESFPLKTKARLIDMLQELRTYSRSLREKFLESAQYIISTNNDQVAREVREWFEGRREENQVELELAQMKEEESKKRKSSGSKSKHHVDGNEEASVDGPGMTPVILRLSACIGLVIVLIVYHIMYSEPEGSGRRMTLATDSRQYDATRVLDNLDQRSNRTLKVKGRRRWIKPYFPKSSRRSDGSFGGEFRSYDEVASEARENAVKTLDESNVSDQKYRDMMVSSAVGSEKLFRAEREMNSREWESAAALLKEALAETREDDVGLKSRILLKLLKCLKGLKDPDGYAAMAEQLDEMRQRLGLMSLQAGAMEGEEATLEKIEADGKAIADMKGAVARMSDSDREGFLETMKRELKSSGLPGPEAEFEFQVLRRRFGL